MRHQNLQQYRQGAVSCLLFSLCLLSANAQYFGKNKVLYQNFDFSVLQTPHFEIYNYLKSDLSKKRLVQWTEQWYNQHLSVLGDSFHKRNPIIIYNHHADFQQTRVIEGRIDVGTGGVTEALRNRVVMPFLQSNAQTDHVLGHELVHAFQYHLIKDSLNLNALNNLPLWMVEGLAEYMSTGYKDANTSMWLRSALAHHTLPRLKDLTYRPDLYFPYRWGEAFWAFVTGSYGDSVIQRLFLETARKGLTAALRNVLKTDERTFSKKWQQSIQSRYTAFQRNAKMQAVGKNLVNKKNGGRLNILPSISPDGKYLAFWTEKNVLSLDLYLADAATGKMIRRITSNAFHAHIDQYSAFESSVAWSPDSKQLAFVAFVKGRNRLLIAGIEGKIGQQIDIPGVAGFSNPAWSPDGKSILVTGLVEGQSDLYVYQLRSGTAKRLTNDFYSDLLPVWSPDGKWIVFATDRLCMNTATSLHQYTHNIALLHLTTGAITNLDFFPGADNLNPVFCPDGHSFYFLSNRDGFRNLYSYDLDSRQLIQCTDFFSGISGVTPYAPAISVSTQTNLLVYGYFDNGDYLIYSNPADDFQKRFVLAQDVQMEAAIMPPFHRTGTDLVQQNIDHPVNPKPDDSRITVAPYKTKFGLDFLGNTGIGLQTGGFASGFAGGVNGIFGDMLGNHQLFGALSLNGEFIDLAGQFAYLNQQHRFNWGSSLSHIPYLSGAQFVTRDTLVSKEGDSISAVKYTLDLLHTFEDQVSVFASYPFSLARRIEFGASLAHYYYRMDRYTEYYDETGTYLLENSRERQAVPKGFSLMQVYIAFVSDNSSFGVASPLEGHRLRVEVGHYFGKMVIGTVSTDYRKYFRLTPFTLATRNLFTGRYGRDAQSGLLPPLFLGYPALVRGYDALTDASNASSGRSINDLMGERIYVSNVEFRFPFSGPERLSALRSRFFFTELNLFTDGGIAWGKSAFMENPVRENFLQKNARYVLSTGMSLRINLLGYLVLEPYYAIPWQNGGWKKRNFGLNILPGW